MKNPAKFMAELSIAQDTSDVLQIYVQRLRRLCEMHGVETGLPECMLGFVQRLCTDRNFAMDFWTMTRSSTRGERVTLSDDEVESLFLLGVGGAGVDWEDAENMTVIEEFERLLGERHGVAGPQLSTTVFPEHLEGGASLPERRFALEVPMVEEESPVVVDTIAEPEVVHEVSGVPAGTTARLEEVLTRLEMTSLELKLHLDNLDERMSRVEPHLEELTLMVSSSVGLSAKGVSGLGKEEKQRPRKPWSGIPAAATRFAVPDVAMPEVQTPKVAKPKVVMPKLAMPRFTMPRIEVPKVEVPEYLRPTRLGMRVRELGGRSWAAVLRSREAVRAHSRRKILAVEWRRGAAIFSGVVVLVGWVFIFNSFGHPSTRAGQQVPAQMPAAVVATPVATPVAAESAEGPGGKLVESPIVAVDEVTNAAESVKAKTEKPMAATSGRTRTASRHRTEVIAAPSTTWLGSARPIGFHEVAKESSGTSQTNEGAGRGGSKSVPD